MNAISLHRPLEGEPLLRPITHRTGGRFASLLISCCLATVETARIDERIRSGFFENEEAGVVVTATSCDRPLFYHECEVLAHFSHKDLALLRFDPLEGASFDVLLEGSQTWQCNYFAWRREGDRLWLIPAHTEGPFFRLSETGLETYQSAPYENGHQRYAGIIRAIETPSFDGRF
ncbi:hypothetical protein P8Q88_05290 [Qipengyuania sp. XHP0207]|uniref:hypothetical protein n=1 Tax=Qipengyuania sp. XHP0207 TaxID=3038078 RepID=UPI00241DC439|nr:hypothetical protein [Qipengyuania sp. XHP0207]MDG5747589.1 hypothetical protein [Qipengyuania sp. XHP0207]